MGQIVSLRDNLHGIPKLFPGKNKKKKKKKNLKIVSVEMFYPEKKLKYFVQIVSLGYLFLITLFW